MANVCGDDCNRPMDSTVKCYVCGCICHSHCYGLNKTIIKAINELPNLTFLCDTCNEKKATVAAGAAVPHVVNNSESNSSMDSASIINAISDLKNMVTGLQDKMSKLEKPSYRSILAGDQPLRGSAKRPRFGDIVDSTPTGRPKKTIIGTNAAEKELSSVEARKWIFVSQLHPTTTDQSFTEYVKKRLNDQADNLKIQAFALVPKERDRRELNFISFKLNIPESSFNAVLNPDIWPKGVMVREFVNDQRRRRPTGHFLTKTPTVDLLG